MAQAVVALAAVAQALPQRPQFIGSASYMGPECVHVGADPMTAHMSVVHMSMSSQE
jgi:hypothetical protein